uniref:Uncharacterized protein n=1 Tax=Glossina palpalis gambiensis TaxID=67801 RepID=A0A1B0BCC0_9MUSC
MYDATAVTHLNIECKVFPFLLLFLLFCIGWLFSQWKPENLRFYIMGILRVDICCYCCLNKFKYHKHPGPTSLPNTRKLLHNCAGRDVIIYVTAPMKFKGRNGK